MLASFIAGFCYGGTTVLVGQPLDTIKTLQQASGEGCKKSIRVITKELWTSGGIPAFYRGGLPLLLGGGLMRSAQFGVYNSSLLAIRDFQGGKTDSNDYLFGFIDPQVVLAGIGGGIGRGLVEGPFEMVKVRRQVQTEWGFRDVLKGSGTTLVRNSFLFSSFVVYMDISKQLGADLSPFWLGGICANLAWMTIWPLDVVKSRMQSGKYEGKSMVHVLMDARRSGHLYRGLLPGLTRSFIANGSSMVVYKYVEAELQNNWGMR
jgi:solute carrier family 25 carnitine/acylcarnitine transporter 20/29